LSTTNTKFTRPAKPASTRAASAAERRREKFLRGSDLLGCDDKDDRFEKGFARLLKKPHRAKPRS